MRIISRRGHLHSAACSHRRTRPRALRRLNVLQSHAYASTCTGSAGGAPAQTAQARLFSQPRACTTPSLGYPYNLSGIPAACRQRVAPSSQLCCAHHLDAAHSGSLTARVEIVSKPSGTPCKLSRRPNGLKSAVAQHSDAVGAEDA